MSCIKSVDKVNQQKKCKNLKSDKFVELGDRGLDNKTLLLFCFVQ